MNYAQFSHVCKSYWNGPVASSKIKQRHSLAVSSSVKVLWVVVNGLNMPKTTSFVLKRSYFTLGKHSKTTPVLVVFVSFTYSIMLCLCTCVCVAPVCPLLSEAGLTAHCWGLALWLGKPAGFVILKLSKLSNIKATINQSRVIGPQANPPSPSKWLKVCWINGDLHILMMKLWWVYLLKCTNFCMWHATLFL